MKDGRDGFNARFTLSERHLFTDSEGDPVTSLVCGDIGSSVMAYSESRRKEKPLTQYQQSVWQAVRARQQRGDPTTRAVLKDDLVAQGIDTNNVGRWIGELKTKQLLAERDGNLYIVSPD